MINIVIPMAGLGSRFKNAGYKNPKPFIDVLGKPMIAQVMENLNYPDSRFILIARKEHLEIEHELVADLKRKYNVVFIGIDLVTEGAACTVLFAKDYIDNSDPLLIANSDQIVDFSIKDFVDDCEHRKLDGSILTFTDMHKDKKWSFAKVDSQGLVEQVKEKDPISDLATIGIYLFQKGKDYVRNAIQMIIRNERTNNEFYVCPVYNYAVMNQLKIGVYNIESDKMHGIGTPEDLEKYVISQSSK